MQIVGVQMEHRGTGEECMDGEHQSQLLSSFPSGFSIDFLGKSAGKDPNGNHGALGNQVVSGNVFPRTQKKAVRHLSF